MLVPGFSIDFWSRSHSYDDSRPMLLGGTVQGWAVRAVGRAVGKSLLCRSEFHQYEPMVSRVPAQGSYTGRLLCSSWDSCRVPFRPSLEQNKGQFASRPLVTTKRTRLDLHFFGKVECTYSDEMEHDPQSRAGLFSGHGSWRGLDSSISTARQEA